MSVIETGTASSTSYFMCIARAQIIGTEYIFNKWFCDVSVSLHGKHFNDWALDPTP